MLQNPLLEISAQISYSCTSMHVFDTQFGAVTKIQPFWGSVEKILKVKGPKLCPEAYNQTFHCPYNLSATLTVIRQSLYTSWHSITCCCTRPSTFECKNSVRLRTHERHPCLALTGELYVPFCMSNNIHRKNSWMCSFIHYLFLWCDFAGT